MLSNKGKDGREVELRKGAYFIQWRYRGEPRWRNLIAIDELRGAKGKPGNSLNLGLAARQVHLREEGGYVQWRWTGQRDWTNLYEIPTGDGGGGDISEKLDQSHSPDTIYAVNATGDQTQLPYSSSANPNSMAFRDGNGVFETGTPTSPAHVTNKQYVDTQTSSKVDRAGDTMTGRLNIPSLVVNSGTENPTPIAINYKSNDRFSSGLAVNKKGNTTSETGNTLSGSEIGYHVFNGFDGTIAKRLAYVIVRALGDTSSSTGGGIYSINTRSANGVEGNRVEITDSNTVFNQRLTVQGAAIASGTAVPEGSVAAPPGSTYIHRTATNGNLRYIKQSGTGNTGWVLDRADNKIEGVGTSKITVSVQEPTNMGIGDIWIPL